MQIIQACELSEPILHYVFINGRELCPEQACELSGACELARVKLSRLYCKFQSTVKIILMLNIFVVNFCCEMQHIAHGEF